MPVVRYTEPAGSAGSGWVVPILVNRFGLVLGLCVLVEVFGGSWVFGTNYGRLNLPRGETVRLDVRGLYPGGGIVTVRHDSHGLRGVFQDPAAIDILTLGDDATAEPLIDDAETWSAQLARAFAAAGQPVAIANAGIAGQSAAGHLNALNAWLPLIDGLAPRLVLVHTGRHDVTVEEAAAADAMEWPDPMDRLRTYATNNSAFFAMARWVGGWFPADPVAASPPPPARTDRPDALEHRLFEFRRRIEALIEAIRARGAEPVLVTPPLTLSDDPLAPFNRVLLEACAFTGTACLDLAGELALEPGHVFAEVHYTPAGARAVAAYLFERLADRFVDRQEPPPATPERP